jgi:hypothetical protein
VGDWLEQRSTIPALINDLGNWAEAKYEASVRIFGE